jgi:hypothetical protein
MKQNRETVAPLPGIMTTLAAGFDLAARHFWLAFIPVLLDVFLWLGPRLSLRFLIERLMTFWPQGVGLAAAREQFLALAGQTNLFSALSVPFVGIPALMAGLAPQKTPLATRSLEMNNLAQVLLLFVAFTLLGLLLTAVYFDLVAWTVRRQRHEGQWMNDAFWRGAFWRHVSRTWFRLLGLAAIFCLGLLLLYIILLPVVLLLSLLGGGLGGVLFFLQLVVAWLLIYLSFTPQGMTLHDRPVMPALIESVRLVQRNLGSTLLLLLSILLIGRGVAWVLLTADDGSWLTLGSIFGHAFISTALLAATFIFYRDRHTRLYGPARQEVTSQA